MCVVNLQGQTTKVDHLATMVVYKNFIIIAVVIWHNVCSCLSKNSPNFKKIYFLSAETSFNTNYVNEFSMKIHRDKLASDIVFNVSRKFPMDFNVKLMAKLKFQTQTMFELNVKYCDFVNKNVKRLTGFIQLWYKDVLSKSNFTKECPIEKVY
ncbi:uncharacterized protein [Musca autumnalis]|uniref:uncharacterized protein n=1 Tax=Musca autumnalis TaxID=221902 RepID=UPI003CF027F3